MLRSPVLFIAKLRKLWKHRKYGHNTDFKHKKKGTSKNGTTLSKYIWTLKDPDDCNLEPCPNKMEYEIKWKILARASGYNPITGLCRLCLKECYFLLFKPETASLNRRSEIYTPCKHRQFKFLDNAKITWEISLSGKNTQCSLRFHVWMLVAEESLYETVCTTPK